MLTASIRLLQSGILITYAAILRNWSKEPSAIPELLLVLWPEVCLTVSDRFSEE
jgi:hypothetical protein